MSAPKYKRVLLKLSGEALMGEQKFGIDPVVANQIATDVAEIQARGPHANPHVPSRQWIADQLRGVHEH